MGKISRRDFLKFTATAGSTLVVGGCFPTISKEPDVILNGTAGDAKKISGLWPEFQSMAKKPFQQLRIGLLQGEEMKIVRFWVDNKGHVYFFNEKTEQAGSLQFGWEGSSPSIKVVDSDGNPLGEYAFWGDKQGAPALAAIDTKQWFTWAVRAVAVSLGVWLVAEVGVFLLSALAFVAFNLMVLGLLLAAGTLVYSTAKLFFGATGITVDDVKEWFLGKVEDLNNFIRQVAEGLGG